MNTPNREFPLVCCADNTAGVDPFWEMYPGKFFSMANVL